jgi:RNA polymerase sigma factor (sigma-70 family)
VGINPVVAALSGPQYPASILIKARQIHGRPEVADMTEEDIRQHLVLGVLAKADIFDPSRAQVLTYIDRVAESAKLMLLRERRARKRVHDRPVISLDEPAAAAGAVGIEHDQFKHLKMRLVASAAAELPSELVEIVRLRANGMSEEAVGHHLNMSRRQVRVALERLRDLFQKLDLTPD